MKNNDFETLKNRVQELDFRLDTYEDKNLGINGEGLQVCLFLIGLGLFMVCIGLMINITGSLN